jgi:broad specificity phosphatase PhoE
MLVTKPPVFLNDEDENSKKQRFYRRYNPRNPGYIRNPVNPVQQTQHNYDLRLIFLRHAERIDQNLGQDWYEKVFGGVPSAPVQAYRHPSLPQRLPIRSNTLLYVFDPPITRDGEQQSFIKGQQLARVGTSVDYCYSSPASRSVLTANALLKGMNRSHVPIRLEPYLFEPMNWNSAFLSLDKIHPFMSKGDWTQTGYNIDHRYRRLSKELNAKETEIDYYHRSQDFFDTIQYRHGEKVPIYPGQRPSRRTTILLVGHASTTEIFSTIALKQPFDVKNLGEQTAKVPYLHTAVLERDAINRIWYLRPVIQYV